MATCYGLDGVEIKSWWEQDFLLLSRLALELTQPYIDSGYTVIPGGKEASVCD